ncbi:MAG: hypothetical protein GXY33_02135 [Phycisphaerae bacterium]|nr:hypothetical protein [Phycisphaerae bacterium]
MQTPRDNVLRAIRHEPPEQLPATLYLEEGLKRRLEECGYRRDEQFVNDTVRILWNVEHRIVDESTFFDPFGVRWQRSSGAYFFEDPPLVEPDAGRIPRIKLLPDNEVQRIVSIRQAHPDRFIFYQFTMTFGERLWALRGMEEYLMDLAVHPTFVHEALDRLLEMHMEALDVLVTLPLDGITFGDDFGSQKGLMISPGAFRTFYKPRLAAMYRRVREAGMVVGAHSCGDNTAIMGDYVDIGLEVFHPLQPECMDIAAIKRDFGRHLAFRGGIGTQGAAAHGTPEEARSAVFNTARILSDGGGYLLEPCKPLPSEAPLETALAFIEAMQEARSYRFP